MDIVDQEFLHEMVMQLDETIRQLVVEERGLVKKLGDARIEELTEYWKKELSEEEEAAFKTTMDYWDKIVVRTWARSYSRLCRPDTDEINQQTTI